MQLFANLNHYTRQGPTLSVLTTSTGNEKISFLLSLSHSKTNISTVVHI